MNIYIKAQELSRVLSQISNLPLDQQQSLINHCIKYDDDFLINLNNIYNKSIEVQNEDSCNLCPIQQR